METTSSGVSIQGALDATAIGNNLIDIVYPIGFIITTFTNTNPSTLLANTTWVRFGEGKCVVGVDDADTDFASGATGGEKEHTLTKDEIPPHIHTYLGNYYDGTTDHGLEYKNTYGYTAYRQPNDTTNGSLDGLQGNAHNNLQPYISCYMWRRTA
jgi:hypothetical protein